MTLGSGSLDAAFERQGRSHPSLFGNVSGLCHADDVVRSAISQRLNGTSRLIPAAGHEAAAIHNEQIGNVVCAVEPVYHRRGWIIAHAASAHEVSGSRHVGNRKSPLLYGAGCGKQVQGAAFKNSKERWILTHTCDASDPQHPGQKIGSKTIDVHDQVLAILQEAVT